VNYIITPHGLILFITAVLSLIVGAIAWQYRYHLSGKILTGLMVCIAIYAFSSAIQAGSPELGTNIIWAKISYLGYVWLTPLCLLFILAFTDQMNWIKAPVMVVITTIPLLTLLLVWTNEFHGLIWSDYTRVNRQPNVWIFEHGQWFLIFVAFQLCMYALSLIVLIRTCRRQQSQYRKQTMTVLVATLFPAVAGVLYSFKLSPIPGFNWMPTFTFFTGLIFTWSIYHYRLLDLVPVARDVLVEQMLDGVVVLDEQQRIIDINPSARKMIERGEEIKIGDPFSTAMPDLFTSLTGGCNRSNTQTLTFRGTSDDDRYIDVRLTLVGGLRSGKHCSLLLLRDITRRKTIEDSLNKANRELERRLEEIQKLQNQLREESLRDPLTSLYNRRYLEDSLQREFAHAQREKYPVSIIMSDIDHFKRINDTYGHNVGDEVLQELSRMLVISFRTEDIICRYGGEEFIIVMPGTPAETALARAETFRQTLENSALPATGQSIHITLSAGIAVYPENGSSVDEIIRLADQALYQAKTGGRNRVVVCNHPASENPSPGNDRSGVVK